MMTKWCSTTMTMLVSPARIKRVFHHLRATEDHLLDETPSDRGVDQTTGVLVVQAGRGAQTDVLTLAAPNEKTDLRDEDSFNQGIASRFQRTLSRASRLHQRSETCSLVLRVASLARPTKVNRSVIAR